MRIGDEAKLESQEGKMLIFISEAKKIAEMALSSPDTEIGGDLFGYYTITGSPIVLAATGPGPRAWGHATQFMQDPRYQQQMFRELVEKYRLYYIGDWHSHHRLSLSEPSRSDDRKLHDLATKNGWPKLFSIIVQIPDDKPRWQLRAPARSRRRNVRAEPETLLGIRWNVFGYRFDHDAGDRRRLAVEIHQGESPLSGNLQVSDANPYAPRHRRVRDSDSAAPLGGSSEANLELRSLDHRPSHVEESRGRVERADERLVAEDGISPKLLPVLEDLAGRFTTLFPAAEIELHPRRDGNCELEVLLPRRNEKFGLIVSGSKRQPLSFRIGRGQDLVHLELCDLRNDRMGPDPDLEKPSTIVELMERLRAFMETEQDLSIGQLRRFLMDNVDQGDKLGEENDVGQLSDE